MIPGSLNRGSAKESQRLSSGLSTCRKDAINSESSLWFQLLSISSHWICFWPLSCGFLNSFEKWILLNWGRQTRNCVWMSDPWLPQAIRSVRLLGDALIQHGEAFWTPYSSQVTWYFWRRDCCSLWCWNCFRSHPSCLVKVFLISWSTDDIYSPSTLLRIRY